MMNVTKSLKIVHKTTPNKHSIPTNDINTTKTRMRGRTIYCLNSTQLLSLSSSHKRHILILNHICIWWSKLCAHLRCIQSWIRSYFKINNEFQIRHLILMITANFPVVQIHFFIAKLDINKNYFKDNENFQHTSNALV